ncbi:MAG: HDIG domain-containing protein [Chloroflexi bacterium]|nr:HDIG domain-containing protein [Chloroflexota bacterium]
MKSRQEIIQLLIENGTGPELLAHVERIERISQLLADQVEAQGGKVNRPVLEAGALLHDLGLPLRQGTPVTIPAFGDKAKGVTSDDILHPITGARRAAELGFPPEVTRCILRHIPGPSMAECETLGLPPPPEETVPEAIEEKIVCYADFLNWVGMLGMNPWKDSEALLKAGVPYLGFFLEQKTGQPLGYDSPAAQRWLTLDAEMRPYARPEFWDMA